MAEHAKLKVDSGVQVYFCEPQSPWQRGTNENTNGLLRQYFPKGTDLARHSPDDLAAPARSTAGHARRSDGGPPLRSSTSTSPQQPDATSTTNIDARPGVLGSGARVAIAAAASPTGSTSATTATRGTPHPRHVLPLATVADQ